MLAESEVLPSKPADRARVIGRDSLTEDAILSKKNASIFRYLLNEFTPVIRSLSKKYARVHYDTRDEADQVLSIELWNAVKAFDPSLGVPFRNFAYSFLQKRFNSWLRLKLYTKKMQFNFRQVRIESLEDGHEICSCGTTDPVLTKYLRESFHDELSRVVRDRLTALEQNVFHLWCKRHSYQEMSQRLGLTPKTIDNAMTRVKQKLRRDKNLYDALTDFVYVASRD